MYTVFKGVPIGDIKFQLIENQAMIIVKEVDTRSAMFPNDSELLFSYLDEDDSISASPTNGDGIYYVPDNTIVDVFMMSSEEERAMIEYLAEEDIQRIVNEVNRGEQAYLTEVVIGDGWKPFTQFTIKELIEEFLDKEVRDDEE